MEEENFDLRKRMLEDIAEIKSQYYVGTGEAFKLIKGIQKMHAQPIEISNLINQEVAKKYSLSYKATPERIVGLEEGLQLCGSEAEFNLELTDEEYSLFRDYKALLLGKVDSLLEDFETSPFMGDAKKSARGFYPLFLNANKNLLSSDQDFGELVLKYIPFKANRNLTEKGNLTVKFDKTTKTYFGAWLISFMIGIQSLDWNKILSGQNLIENERDYKETLISTELSNLDIVQRLIRDKLDHRWEYRRSVACKWLSSAKIKTYDDAILGIEQKIASRVEQNERLKAIHAPNMILDNSNNLVAESRFIRHVLGSDRNFFQRYLRS